MKNKLKQISIRIPEKSAECIRVLAKNNSENISDVFEWLLSANTSVCPCCKKKWPTDNDPKTVMTTIIPKNLVSKKVPQKFYLALLQHALGFCPVCSQQE